MAQGSPPSPRTRESMLGSAFAAVKSYFTPERNNSRANEGLGITPLARDFASLTLDDSTQDTTDSFKTTHSRFDESFQSTCSDPDETANLDSSEKDDNLTVIVEETFVDDSIVATGYDGNETNSLNQLDSSVKSHGEKRSKNAEVYESPKKVKLSHDGEFSTNISITGDKGKTALDFSIIPELKEDLGVPSIVVSCDTAYDVDLEELLEVFTSSRIDTSKNEVDPETGAFEILSESLPKILTDKPGIKDEEIRIESSGDQQTNQENVKPLSSSEIATIVDIVSVNGKKLDLEDSPTAEKKDLDEIVNEVEPKSPEFVKVAVPNDGQILVDVVPVNEPELSETAIKDESVLVEFKKTILTEPAVLDTISPALEPSETAVTIAGSVSVESEIPNLSQLKEVPEDEPIKEILTDFVAVNQSLVETSEPVGTDAEKSSDGPGNLSSSEPLDISKEVLEEILNNVVVTDFVNHPLVEASEVEPINVENVSDESKKHNVSASISQNEILEEIVSDKINPPVSEPSEISAIIAENFSGDSKESTPIEKVEESNQEISEKNNTPEPENSEIQILSPIVDEPVVKEIQLGLSDLSISDQTEKTEEQASKSPPSTVVEEIQKEAEVTLNDESKSPILISENVKELSSQDIPCHSSNQEKLAELVDDKNPSNEKTSVETKTIQDSHELDKLADDLQITAVDVKDSENDNQVTENELNTIICSTEAPSVQEDEKLVQIQVEASTEPLEVKMDLSLPAEAKIIPFDESIFVKEHDEVAAQVPQQLPENVSYAAATEVILSRSLPQTEETETFEQNLETISLDETNLSDSKIDVSFSPEELPNQDDNLQFQVNVNNFLTPIQEVQEDSFCSAVSMSSNQLIIKSQPKSDAETLRNSFDSPSDDVIRKGKFMIESTPQPAGIAKRIAPNNMSDVSPIVISLGEEPASENDSPYSKYLLDQAMIQSTPETTFGKCEDLDEIVVKSGAESSGLNATKVLPNSGLSESKTSQTSVLNETNTLQKSVLNETKILPCSGLNETKTLQNSMNDTKILPSSGLNETKTLHNSMNETKILPGAGLDETKILDNRFDETHTLSKAPELNSTVVLDQNLDHTISLAKAVETANMNVTRILMNEDVNSSLVAAVSPFNCKNISSKVNSSTDTPFIIDLNDETRENWNATTVNKNKNPGNCVLREINDNVLDNGMGAWFSSKMKSPEKINQTLAKNEVFSCITNFEIFNSAKIEQPTLNRESIFIKFDPCYQPKGLIDVINVDNNSGQKPAASGALDLLGLEMSTQSNQEKLQNEIDRLRALYEEREQEAQSKFNEIQARSDDLEKQYVESRNTLDALEERHSKMERQLQHVGTSNLKLAHISQNHQKVVENLRADLKNRLGMEKQNPVALAAERDSYQQHLKSAEAAFIDVLTKYEKMRNSLLELKKSVAERERESAELRRESNRLDELLRVAETTVKASLEDVQRKAREEEEQYNTDVTRITAQLRKTELSLKHSQDSYDKTVHENEKIAALCDDIIAGRS